MATADMQGMLSAAPSFHLLHDDAHHSGCLRGSYRHAGACHAMLALFVDVTSALAAAERHALVLVFLSVTYSYIAKYCTVLCVELYHQHMPRPLAARGFPLLCIPVRVTQPAQRGL
jgi:hypothetical protein